MNIFIGWGLGVQADLVHYMVFIPITSLVLLLPITVAGLGAREEAYRQLFGQVGVPAETAVAMSLLVYIFGNICAGLIGGLIYFLRGARDIVSKRETVSASDLATDSDRKEEAPSASNGGSPSSLADEAPSSLADG